MPFVLEVRDLWPESMVAAGGRKGPFYFGLALLARWLYRYADGVVVLTDGVADHLERLGAPRARIASIPNGVQADRFAGIQRPVCDRTRFIYAGAHGAANGLEVVLRAARLLTDRGDVSFLLVGDGPEKPALMTLAKELDLRNVAFRDAVPSSQMPQVLAEADAGLMVLRESPLFSFGVSPNKLLDYFAAGLPVVCNVPGELTQIVRDVGAGEVAPSGSPEGLAEAVVRLQNELPVRRQAMGRAGRDWVIPERAPETLAGRLDRTLREVLHRVGEVRR